MKSLKYTFEPDNLSYNFVGREQELDTLDKEVIQGNNRIIAITGMAGVGKTSLAFMFSHRFGDNFPGGIFHLHGIDLEMIPKFEEQIKPKQDQPSLLIIDNLDRLSDSEVESRLEHILSLWPLTRILITSRRVFQVPSIKLQLKLPPLKKAEAEELIHKILGRYYDPSTIEEFYTHFKGHPYATDLASIMLKDGFFTPRELFESLKSFTKPGLVGPDGRPIKPYSKPFEIIVRDVITVNNELMRKLSDNPKLLYELSPRLFEEVVAEILRRQGYDVTLTPASRDGGKDIYVAKKDVLGSFLYLVECKKYAPNNRVGVGLVQKLHGVVQAEKATAGILATTSFFTKGAKEFQEQVAYQISLQDYFGIQKWLKNIKP